MTDTPLATALREYRSRSGMTRQEMADAIGIDVRRLDDHLSGRAGDTAAGRIAAWAMALVDA